MIRFLVGLVVVGLLAIAGLLGWGNYAQYQEVFAARELAVKEKLATEKVGELTNEVKKLAEAKSGLEATIRTEMTKAKEAEVKESECRQRIVDLQAEVKKLAEAKEKAEKEIVRRDREKEITDAAKDKVTADEAKAKADLEEGLVPREELAKNPSSGVKVRFITWVVATRDTQSYPLLAELMADSDSAVADKARNALSHDLDKNNLGIGKDAVAPIIAVITNPKLVPMDEKGLAAFRGRAGQALVNIGAIDGSAIDALINLFASKDAETRNWAMNCVVQIGTPAEPRLMDASKKATIGALALGVKDKIAENREKAIRAEAVKAEAERAETARLRAEAEKAKAVTPAPAPVVAPAPAPMKSVVKSPARTTTCYPCR